MLTSQTSAVAVVNGSEITNADATKPWVAQIYWAETTEEYSERDRRFGKA